MYGDVRSLKYVTRKELMNDFTGRIKRGMETAQE
jgi:hypothetical protein